MERAPHLTFGPFRLDTEEKRVWRGERQLPLRPPCVSVLQMLVENANEILTREQILRHVWPGKYPTIVALRVCISEIRQALEDDPKSPQYIETVGHKGYRYIGSTVGGKTALIQREMSKGFEHIVGREDELEQLDKWFGKARRYVRQIVFITGEPGIGKTTLVEMVLARLRTDRRVRIGRGQCLEQYGEGEPYLPILEAFGRLCSDPGGAPIKALLNRCAPTWMIQMPGLLSSEEIASLQQRIQGANQQRMLREIADALEALTYETFFVLVLEDLHWSDYSTLELLAYLAQRQERLRLMVIATYRPADLTTGHPLKKLKRELQLHHQCEELSLSLLNKGEVATYVSKLLPENVLSTELSDLIHRRTEGNAMFMVNMVNMLHEQMVEQDGHWELPVNVEDLRMPESLRQVIEEKLDRLSADDRQILEAASAEGREFSCAAIAVATGRDPIEIEERCAALMRQSQFIQETEVCTWPDGTITVRYEFIHALYHEVFYSRLTPGRRAQLHQRISERLEQGYRDRTGEIAAELALHFEHGRDFHRAVAYLQQAAEQATQRFAYPECIRYLTRALGLLQTFTDTPERKQLELRCQISLGVALMTTKGYADPEAKQAYDRARELCQQIGQTPQLMPVLWGLAAFYYVRAELTTAHDLGEQFMRAAQEENDHALLLEAHQELGGTSFNLGEFISALQYLERGIHLYDPQKYREHAMLYGQDPGVSCLSRAPQVLWLLGYPDQALARCHDSLVLAKDLGHPHSSTYVLIFAAMTHQLRGEPQMAQLQAEAALKLATEHGFSIWKSMGEIFRGWSIASQGGTREGIAFIQQGIAMWRAAGAEISLPYYLSLLAETYGRDREPKAGIKVLDEALSLVSRTEDRFWEAELYRLKGNLILQIQRLGSEVRGQKEDQKAKDKKQRSTSPISLRLMSNIEAEAEAEICFQQALKVARQQQAKSLELRTAMSLTHLWKKQQKKNEARQLLAEVYGRFTEGFETPDLQEAKALLGETTEKVVTVGSSI